MSGNMVRVSVTIVVVGLVAAVAWGALLVSSHSGHAVAAVGPFAYVANGFSGEVTVIDLPSETEDTTITTGGSPYWVAISADASTVAASLHGSTGVALIDGTTNTLIGVVGGVGTEPEAVAVNSDGATVYVADESGANLYAVDVATEEVTAGPIDLSPCSEPENMVISPDDAFLYITCASSSNSVAIRVATAGFGITTVASGLSDPHGIAINPAGTRVYYTDGTDGFEWDTGSQAPTGTTFSGCDMYGGRVSPDGTKLFCKAEFGDLRVYNTSDGSLIGNVSIGGEAVDVSSDGAKAYLPTGNVVEVVDVATVTDLPGSISMTNGNGRGIAVAPAQAAPTPTPTPTATATAIPTPTPTPVPSPTAQAPAQQLPETGGAPSGGSDFGSAWVALAAVVAIMASSGMAYALVRRRRW